MRDRFDKQVAGDGYEKVSFHKNLSFLSNFHEFGIVFAQSIRM